MRRASLKRKYFDWLWTLLLHKGQQRDDNEWQCYYGTEVTPLSNCNGCQSAGPSGAVLQNATWSPFIIPKMPRGILAERSRVAVSVGDLELANVSQSETFQFSWHGRLTNLNPANDQTQKSFPEIYPTTVRLTMYSVLNTPSHKPRRRRAHHSTKSHRIMGLHWAFIVAAIFGVFAIAVPIARAQQQSTTVDDQGPIIGMRIISQSREA